jgi:hypothetical protein
LTDDLPTFADAVPRANAALDRTLFTACAAANPSTITLVPGPPKKPIKEAHYRPNGPNCCGRLHHRTQAAAVTLHPTKTAFGGASMKESKGTNPLLLRNFAVKRSVIKAMRYRFVKHFAFTVIGKHQQQNRNALRDNELGRGIIFEKIKNGF